MKEARKNEKADRNLLGGTLHGLPFSLDCVNGKCLIRFDCCLDRVSQQYMEHYAITETEKEEHGGTKRAEVKEKEEKRCVVSSFAQRILPLPASAGYFSFTIKDCICRFRLPKISRQRERKWRKHTKATGDAGIIATSLSRASLSACPLVRFRLTQS